MSSHIRRAAATLAVTATSIVGLTVLATPAWAADTVRVNLGNLIVAGDSANNNIRFTRSGPSTVVMTDQNATITAGPGCVQLNAKAVSCSGVEALNVNGRDGHDFINNDTEFNGGPSLPGTLGGGPGNDTLFGGLGQDELLGGAGIDHADGSGGNVDRCIAETEVFCELN